MSREGMGVYLVHNRNVICLEYKVRGRAVTEGVGTLFLPYVEYFSKSLKESRLQYYEG